MDGHGGGARAGSRSLASFSLVIVSLFQIEHEWEPYIARVHDGLVPIYRALTPNQEELMIREFILQMKLGRVRVDYFRHKFGVDVRDRFSVSLDHLKKEGLLQVEAENLQ